MQNSRKEIKFICSYSDSEILKAQLLPFCDYECYDVKSLYFDTLNKKTFSEKEDGINNRKKYRIRTYSTTDKFYFEIKKKNNSTTIKQKELIEKKLIEKIIKNNLTLDDVSENSLILNIFNLNLNPNVIVRYKREAFSYPVNNFRITLDYNIEKSYDFENFLTENIDTQAIEPFDKCIIEVKYNESIPFFFKKAFQNISTKKIAYSKHYHSNL